MNASRAKRFAGGLSGVVFLACATWPVSGWTQDGAPVELTPPIRLEPAVPNGLKPARPSPSSVGYPQSPQPHNQMGGALSGGAVGQNTISGGGYSEDIQTQKLEGVNPDLAGTLREDQGGFGIYMWQGTSRKVVEALLPQLPAITPSLAMRDLMRRLLLTGAQVPQNTPPGSLIVLRAQLLSAMGDFGGVNALLSVVPGRQIDQGLMRIEVDTRFLTGDVARACRLAAAYIQDRQDTYWQKAFIFCQAMEGDRAGARLGISLLEEMGVQDQVFFDLIDALVRRNADDFKPPVIESLADPEPLHLAMARVVKARLPDDVISSNRPGVLRAIAISPNASVSLRLEAAERAEHAGALDVDALRQLYTSIEFSEEQLQNPLSQAALLSGPTSRALLYRATLMQTVATAQAETLQRALDLAQDAGRYASTARAFLPQIGRVPITRELAWFAPEAIRAYLITGRPVDAKDWFDLLQREAYDDAQLTVQLQALMPVARLAGAEWAEDWSLDQLNTWWESVKHTSDARDKAVMVAAVFDALGETIPLHIWDDLIVGEPRQTGWKPHPSLLFLLDSASSVGRTGETVLLSLIVLGDGGPARVDPVVLHRVMKALNAVGLNAEARAVALETAVAAGL